MILLTTLIAGGLVGYFAGAGRKGHAVFLAIWAVVFAAQTAMLLSISDDVRHRDSGAWEPMYFVLSTAVLLLGLFVLQVAASLARRRSEQASPAH